MIGLIPIFLLKLRKCRRYPAYLVVVPFCEITRTKHGTAACGDCRYQKLDENHCDDFRSVPMPAEYRQDVAEANS